MAEAPKSAIVDTACTKTVGGLHWFNSYVDSLDKEQRKKVEIIESNASFKFGDSRQMKSQKRARIPAQIGDKSCLIEMEIVKENIPLLLSKSSLKKAETVLDMEMDQAVTFGKRLTFTFLPVNIIALTFSQIKWVKWIFQLKVKAKMFSYFKKI